MTGPPGSGKTTAAIAALKEITRKFTRLPLIKCRATRDWSAKEPIIQCKSVANPDGEQNTIITPVFLSTRDYIDCLRERIANKERFGHKHFASFVLGKQRTSGYGDISAYSVTVIDDLGTENLGGNGWIAEELHNLVNSAYENRLPLIITTNFTMRDLEERVGSRIVDRLKEMTIVRAIHCESWRSKRND